MGNKSTCNDEKSKNINEQQHRICLSDQSTESCEEQIASVDNTAILSEVDDEGHQTIINSPFVDVKNDGNIIQTESPLHILSESFIASLSEDSHLNRCDCYVITRTLGKGQYGECMLCVSTEDQQKYVIKEIDLALLSPTDAKNATQEVELLAHMSHPFIVKFKESFRKKSKLCIVMEYCEGGDLGSQISAKIDENILFSEDQILDWICQMVLALEYCHFKKILHRDLKTQNIFLTKNNIIKLGDFGIARHLHSNSEFANTVIGTPYILSPEMCQRHPYSFKADIWSLGCTVFELCMLKRAFEAEHLLALVFRIVSNEAPPILETYSSDLQDLVNQMLSKDPNLRPDVTAILESACIKKKVDKFRKLFHIPSVAGMKNSDNASSTDLYGPDEIKSEVFSFSKKMQQNHMNNVKTVISDNEHKSNVDIPVDSLPSPRQLMASDHHSTDNEFDQLALQLMNPLVANTKFHKSSQTPLKARSYRKPPQSHRPLFSLTFSPKKIKKLKKFLSIPAHRLKYSLHNNKEFALQSSHSSISSTASRDLVDIDVVLNRSRSDRHSIPLEETSNSAKDEAYSEFCEIAACQSVSLEDRLELMVDHFSQYKDDILSVMRERGLYHSVE